MAPPVHRIWTLDAFCSGHSKVAATLHGLSVRWEEGDTADVARVADLLDRVGFVAYLHLVDSIRVEESMIRPDLHSRDNLRPRTILLEAPTSAHPPALVFIFFAARHCGESILEFWRA